MKLTLAEPKYLKDSLAIISEIVTEATIHLTDNGMQLIAMDPANVAMVSFQLLSSSFVTYEKKDTEKFTINLNTLKQVLRRIKGGDTLTMEDEENKLKLTLQSSSKRTFYLPLIELEDKNQKVPDLSFTVTVNTASQIFNDAVEDVDVVGESVHLSASPNIFSVSSKGDISKVNVDIPADTVTAVNCEDEDASAKYSIEYLKKMMQGAKLADTVAIKFSKDYPLRLEYVVQNKVELAFVLAPRVNND
jgi:proliferating cell nuclear antigen